jgi:hypothetical protein
MQSDLQQILPSLVPNRAHSHTGFDGHPLELEAESHRATPISCRQRTNGTNRYCARPDLHWFKSYIVKVSSSEEAKSHTAQLVQGW